MKSTLTGVVAILAEEIQTAQMNLIDFEEARERIDKEEVAAVEHLRNLEVARRVILDLSNTK